MKATEVREDQINGLNYLVKNYEGIVNRSVAAQNRLHSINPGCPIEHDPVISGLKNLIANVNKALLKAVREWDIWNLWLDKVPGIGPWLAGELILLFYYRFSPICPKCSMDIVKDEEKKTYWCPKCEKSVKGEGNLTFRIDHKRFENISSWWHYVGRHIVDGEMPKRKKGTVSDWSTKGRTVVFHIGEQFIKQGDGHLYRRIYDEQKAKYERTRAE